MAKVTPITEQFQHFVSELKESFWGDMQAYICGLHQMVDANRRLLKEELGWDRKQIVFERYDLACELGAWGTPLPPQNP